MTKLRPNHMSLFLMVVVLTALLLGCSSDEADPTDTVEAMYQSLEEGDFDAYSDTIIPSARTGVNVLGIAESVSLVLPGARVDLGALTDISFSNLAVEVVEEGDDYALVRATGNLRLSFMFDELPFCELHDVVNQESTWYIDPTNPARTERQGQVLQMRSNELFALSLTSDLADVRDLAQTPEALRILLNNCLEATALASQPAQPSGAATETAAAPTATPTLTPTPFDLESALATISAIETARPGAESAATAAAMDQEVADLQATISAVNAEATRQAALAVTATRQAARDCTSRVVPLLEAGDYSALVPGSQLGGCVLSERELFGLDLTAADLSLADLSGANLQNTNLTNANLSGADLRFANLDGAILTDATMVGALIDVNHLPLLDDAQAQSTIWFGQFPEDWNPDLSWTSLSSPDGRLRAVLFRTDRSDSDSGEAFRFEIYSNANGEVLFSGGFGEADGSRYSMRDVIMDWNATSTHLYLGAEEHQVLYDHERGLLVDLNSDDSFREASVDWSGDGQYLLRTDSRSEPVSVTAVGNGETFSLPFSCRVDWEGCQISFDGSAVIYRQGQELVAWDVAAEAEIARRAAPEYLFRVQSQDVLLAWFEDSMEAWSAVDLETQGVFSHADESRASGSLVDESIGGQYAVVKVGLDGEGLFLIVDPGNVASSRYLDLRPEVLFADDDSRRDGSVDAISFNPGKGGFLAEYHDFYGRQGEYWLVDLATLAEPITVPFPYEDDPLFVWLDDETILMAGDSVLVWRIGDAEPYSVSELASLDFQWSSFFGTVYSDLAVVSAETLSGSGEDSFWIVPFNLIEQ